MSKSVKIIFLGTGTSQGVPVIACKCKVCQSNDKHNVRLRASVLIQINNKRIVIDTGPDFRQQMLTNHVQEISAVLFTHEHKDHVAGLDDIRPYNFIQKKAIDVYAEERVQESLRREYAYIFADYQYPGIPQINMHLISNNPFYIDDVEVIPIRAYHYKLPVLGFRIENFCYLTDIKTVPEEEFNKLLGIDTLVVNALRKEEHVSHLNLEEALKLIEKIKPKKAYLTHLSHSFGLHAEEEAKLPKNVFIAFDNLCINS
jgi:phosphoribosyl 1,2-cyclic phosphate phosphodiesterase